MTQEEFISILDKKRYSYEIEGDQIVVTDDGNVDLESLTSLPPGVKFENEGDVYLSSLTSLPPGVEFRNDGGVYMPNLMELAQGVVFKNERSVNLNALTGGWFDDWRGNIEGIDSKRLLDKMIKDGVFER